MRVIRAEEVFPTLKALSDVDSLLMKSEVHAIASKNEVNLAEDIESPRLGSI